MCKKYIGLLLFVVATMFVGCAEDPFDWSGDSARTVPEPIELSLQAVEDVVYASCSIEYHDDDLPILDVGFFYGNNSKVNFDTGERVRTDWSSSNFSTSEILLFPDYNNNLAYCYVGAYITTSRGTVTVGPNYVENRW